MKYMVKAATGKTPQPSSTYDSAVIMVQGQNQEYITTPARLAALRGTSLVRDHHRCVVSRVFDIEEFERRIRREGEAEARDDDGNPLSGPFGHLEVAHIIPHSLTRPQEGSEVGLADINKPNLDEMLKIDLNMLDTGVARLIEGVGIDRPLNALSLSLDHHRWFGAFKIFFTPVPDEEPHAYKIETFLRASFPSSPLPVTRTLLLSPGRNIDPPSSRLLAVHRAIAHILHLSGAGAYIDRFLREMDEGFVQADGSTQLDKYMRLRLKGG